MEHDAFSEDQLAKALASHVDCTPTDIQFTPCASGKHNTTYFVEGVGRPLVLRIAPADDPSKMLFYEYRMMRQEQSIHQVVKVVFKIRENPEEIEKKLKGLDGVKKIHSIYSSSAKCL